VTADNHNR